MTYLIKGNYRFVIINKIRKKGQSPTLLGHVRFSAVANVTVRLERFLLRVDPEIVYLLI